MAEKVFIAKEQTAQEILSNTEKILAGAGNGKAKRYGMRINLADSNPETRVTYLYDAVGMQPARMNFTSGMFDYGDWGDVWFVKNNRPVMLLNDGTIDYELDHENHALKLDGGASDIASSAYMGNAMSEIPLIWVKRYKKNNYHFVIFCESQFDETYKPYAHTDVNKNILPVKYWPMYEGCVINSRMRSLSGQTVTVSLTDEQETAAAQQNGELWDKLSYSDCELMWEMCTMISKSTNSQAAFGSGNSGGSSYLKTGTMNGLGQFYGYSATGNGVKLFYCENFYGNYWKRIRGIINDKGNIKVKFTPPYDSTGKDYISTGVTPAGTSGGYINRMEMTDGGRIPALASGSETTFECDSLYYNNSQVDVALFGGARGVGTWCGVSCWNLNALATYVDASIGASLSCFPPVTA